MHVEKSTIRKPKLKVPDHIEGNLYLGCENCGSNLEALKELNITRVIIACQYVEPVDPVNIEYLVCDIDDDPSENIAQHFDECIEFIDSSPDNVLIHCISGISRSGAIVIAYCMKKKGMSYQEALEFV